MHIANLDDLASAALVVLAWLIGWWQRNAKSKRRWRLIREQAQAELESPTGTNDPETAIVKATLEVNRPAIAAETQRLRTTTAAPRVQVSDASARTPRRESEDGDHS